MAKELDDDVAAIGGPLIGLIRSTRTMPNIIPIVCLTSGLLLGYLLWR
jgi:hypothetical protein